eukprot:scaffold37054_cov72-Cyclotella_meneghiniana.AAC.2
MAPLLATLVLSLLLLSPTAALHADEAGLTDFLIRTPGHGHHGVQYGQTLKVDDDIVWVTSESGPGSIDSKKAADTSCYVAGRNVTDGAVLWRVNACSSPDGSHSALVVGEMVHTLDDRGLLTGWKMDGLKWNVDVISSFDSQENVEASRLISANYKGNAIIGSVLQREGDEYLVIHDSLTGEAVTPAALSAKTLLQKAKLKSSSRSHIIGMLSSNSKLGIISGYSNDKNEVNLSSVAYTELEAGQSASTIVLKLAGDVSNVALTAASIRAFAFKERVYVMGIEKGKNSKFSIATFGTRGKIGGKVISMGFPQLEFTGISVDESTETGRVLGIVGEDVKGRRVVSVVTVKEKTEGELFFDKNSTGENHDALVYCSNMDMALGASEREDGSTVISSSGAVIKGDNTLSSSSGEKSIASFVDMAYLVECKADFMTVAFTTKGGTTSTIRLDKHDSTAYTAKELWTTEEALGSISSAVFLDETHAVSMSSDGSVNADEEEKNALQKLEFSSRMQAQMSSLKNFLFEGGIFSSLASMALMSDEKKAERNFHFGFAKLSILLSESMSRIIALDTAKEGKVVWAMNLNPDGVVHKVIHGGQSSSLNDPHGYGGVHDHELLVMSLVPTKSKPKSSIEWRCFDGMTGKVFSNDTVTVSSGIAQIVPLRSHLHHSTNDNRSCRQVALVIHDDDSISLIPDSDRSYAIADEAMSSAEKSGLFVHTIDKDSGVFRAMRVARKSGSSLKPGSKPFELVTVGKALFDPSHEKIVNIAYPQRNEVIQSPSTVLGDDALLLKYLNPHLVVVVTEATKSFLAEVTSESGTDGESFYNALASADNSSSGQKRKPLGASKPGEAPPVASSMITPSLFVSLVDSVSGQILHRVSHAHATKDDIKASINVPVIISENWVVYSFFNQRTRRTDVGVLTLHEGMIDKNGLTAFNGPEQEVIFSSLESAKPIVLSKTFGITKVVTALGVTVTKAGISSKQFLFATSNDQVISMDRRLMDPRRPNGELKTTEKLEGLVQ